MLAREDIGFLEHDRQGLERHRSIMIEKGFAYTEKLLLHRSPANAMKKFAGRFDTEPDEIEIFLHFLDVS